MGEGGGGFLAGLAMTITAACISGFAGVYTEMLLKSSATSLWIRQIQARRDIDCMRGSISCRLWVGRRTKDQE